MHAADWCRLPFGADAQHSTSTTGAKLIAGTMRGTAIRTALVAGVLGACAEEAPLPRSAASSEDGGSPKSIDAARVAPFEPCPRILLDGLTPRDGERCNVDPRFTCGFTAGLTACLVHGSITKQCLNGKWMTLSEIYPSCGTGGGFAGSGGYPMGRGGADGGNRDAGADASVAGAGGRSDAGRDASDSGDGALHPRD